MLESMKEAYFRSLKETIFMIFSYVRSVDYEEDYCFCDVYSIPLATNLGTAEILIKGLERGDFAWRDVLAGRKGEKND